MTAAAGRGILMIPGAFCGAWCWDGWRKYFEDLGYDVDSPSLPHHDPALSPDREELAGLGLTEYCDFLARRIDPENPPIIFGHSMGGLLAQKLAARDLARALVLVASAAPAGNLPGTPGEAQAAMGLMSLGAFWTTCLDPVYEVAAMDSLASMPEEQKRAVFEKFGPESGKVLFQMMFWMFDADRASAVRAMDVTCPVLAVGAEDDVLCPPHKVRALAERYEDQATFTLVSGFGHMLPVEDGWQTVAAEVADWLRGNGL